jgi:hypothetical protein
MTGWQLAQKLGRVRDSLGIIEGYARAMKESVDRELDEGHFSEQFTARFEEALEQVRVELDECFEAVDDMPNGNLK